MRKKFANLKSKIRGSLLVIVSGSSIAVYGAGFQINEQSVTNLGRAFAGVGVAAEDASILFYNPAGMMQLRDSRLQGGVSGIFLDADFKNDGNSIGSGFDGGSDTASPVPNLFYVTDYGDQMKVGIGITAPFGLRTEYDDDWIGRYQAIESELLTVDIGPSLAYRINDRLSVGGGLNVQYAEATLSQATPPIFSPTAGDAFTEVSGDSWAYGFNLGLTYRPVPKALLGISYRSKIKHELKGSTRISGSDIGLDGRYTARTEVELPESAILSASYDVNRQWQLFATARWTKWQRFDELVIESSGLPDQVIPEQWDNAWMYSVGANYHLHEQIMLRAGFAIDQTPVPNAALRTPRVPDSDRQWWSLGLSYYPSDQLSVDLGMAYLDADEASIDNSVLLPSSVQPISALSGSYDSNVTIVGAQVQYHFNF